VQIKHFASLAAAAAMAALAALAGCGGSANVANPAVTGSQSLSFAYFQRCINPIFQAQLQTSLNGTTQLNTCAAAGCHAAATGAGGALRIVPGAQIVDLSDPANTPAVIMASDMFRNFYSAQGEVVIASPALSKLLNKPELHNTLHGGGLIFTSTTDPHVQLITYWINNPVPVGQDEFSASASSMFTPQDVMSGTCNTQ